MESILAVFNDGGDRFEHIAVPVLYGFLQVEVLDRNVIGTEPELAAHGLEVGLFHGLAHCFLVGKVALRRDQAELISIAAS